MPDSPDRRPRPAGAAGGPAPGIEPELLDVLTRELDLLVGRARALAPARWSLPLGAPTPFATRADALFHLAAWLAAASGAPVPLPRLTNPLALGDQLAVVGDDLVGELRTGRRPVGAASAALGELLLHRHDLDGVRPGQRAGGLAVGGELADADVVLRTLTARCPAYRQPP